MSRDKIWKSFYSKNIYYHKRTQKIVSDLVPNMVSLLEFSSKGGEILKSLKNKQKAAVEFDEDLYNLTKKNRLTTYFHKNKISYTSKKFDYILLSHTLAEIDDAQNFISELSRISKDDARIVVLSYNFLWKPILDIAEKLGLKLPQKSPNWFTQRDIRNIFHLEGYEVVKEGKRFILPYDIPYVSDFVNKYISPLPIINHFCLIQFSVFRRSLKKRDLSVSVIIPARNESGHMKGVLKRIPNMGTRTEVVFVEGGSSDDTYEVIRQEIKNYKGPLKASLHRQKGKGKGDAVRLGFSKAKNELLMIQDADLTVDPSDLPKFYNAVSENKGEFVMGSRLIYPMESQAMRTLNMLGNHFFGFTFSYLLGQRMKDTLCGTKVISIANYQKIAANRSFFGDFDPFGDFDLIFGSAKLNLKILEIPVRYKDRAYGDTNISRFSHGWLLLKMTAFAAQKLKFN